MSANNENLKKAAEYMELCYGLFFPSIIGYTCRGCGCELLPVEHELYLEKGSTGHIGGAKAGYMAAMPAKLHSYHVIHFDSKVRKLTAKSEKTLERENYRAE